MPGRGSLLILLIFFLAASSCKDEEDRSVDLTSEVVAQFVVRNSVCRNETTPAASIELFSGLAVGEPLQGKLNEIVDCVISADDCYEFMACYGMDPKGKGCVIGSNPTCDGNEVESCQSIPNGEAFRFRNNCEDGWSCQQEFAQEQQTAACRPETTCGVDSSICDGNELAVCTNGYEYRTDCSQRGMQCAMVVAAGSANGCGFPDYICEQSAQFCKGNQLWTCDGTTLSGGLDCTLQTPQGRCSDLPYLEQASAIACAPPQATEHLDKVVRCKGSTMATCVGDHCIEYDCSSFMDATCTIVDQETGIVSCVSSSWTVIRK